LIVPSTQRLEVPFITYELGLQADGAQEGQAGGGRGEETSQRRQRQKQAALHAILISHLICHIIYKSQTFYNLSIQTRIMESVLWDESLADN
jgi:hypothetical protein